MIETQLSIFDAVVLGILVVCCLFAFFRGFVREILSLGAWIGAAGLLITAIVAAIAHTRELYRIEDLRTVIEESATRPAGPQSQIAPSQSPVDLQSQI